MPLVVGILCGDAFPHVFSVWEYGAGFLLFFYHRQIQAYRMGVWSGGIPILGWYRVLLDELAAGKDGISLFGQNCCL